MGPHDAELMALERNARELFRDVVARSPQLSDDLQTAALNIDDPVRLADFIAANLPSLPTLLRQELLETADVRRRLETLIRELVQGTRRILELAQQDSGAGSGTSEPEPARISVAASSLQRPFTKSWANPTTVRRKLTNCARSWKSPGCPPRRSRNANAS